MIIFSKYGEYDRRDFIEQCLDKYLETTAQTKLCDKVCEGKNKNNKPYFKDYPNIRFSISHSGNLVVLAMSSCEVGIDIEEIKERPYQKIVDGTFSAGEKAQVKDINSFLAVWTKKEAYLKFTSDGIGAVRQADISQEIVVDDKPLKFTSLEIFDGFIGAVVSVEQPIIYVSLD